VTIAELCGNPFPDKFANYPAHLAVGTQPRGNLVRSLHTHPLSLFRGIAGPAEQASPYTPQ